MSNSNNINNINNIININAQEECLARGAGDFCLSCLLIMAGLFLAVAVSFVYLAIDFAALFSQESILSMQAFVISFFPPDSDPAFWLKVAKGTLQTFSVATVATVLASLASAVLMALPAAGRLGQALRRMTRFILIVLRSVPELVWAALMVLVAGLGPFAGSLALALHTTGVLGRLFAQAIENTSIAAEQSLNEIGASPMLSFIYGTLPQVWPQFLNYILYRLEMNIRMATVLGFVGAGGLGQMLYFHLALFQQAQATTVLIAMLMLILMVDSLSNWLRARLSTT